MKNLNDTNVRSNENEQNGRTSMKHRVRAYLSKTLVVFMSMILVWGTSPITQLVYAEELNNTEAYSTEVASSAEGEAQAVSDESATPVAESTESASTTTAGADTTAATANSAATESSTATSSTETTTTSTDAVNLVAENSDKDDKDADETASSEEEGIALASNEQDDTVTPGTYGSYTYKQNTLKNAFETSEYDGYRDPVATQWLGVAGSFHITGFDEVNTSSHIYGNILTNTLNGGNNFGQTSWYENTYGYRPLSYVQNYTTPSSNPSGINDSVFVIGSGSKVTKVDNGNHLAIDGVQLNEPKTLIQDADTATAPFIDLAAVKAKTIEVSDNLAKVADVGASVSKEGSNTYINYEGDSGCAYVTFKASELNSMDQLYIKDMALNGLCSVVVNVEMDTNDLNLSKIHVLLPNGQTAGTGETDSTVGYVMFNIKNSTSAMTISLSDRVLASVLAPNSTINLGGSAAGTFIGSKVNVTAESHARPFRGTLKPVVDTLSVKKVWKDAYGNEELADVANAHGAVTVKVYQRSKAKDASDWGAWTEYETVTLSKDNGWAKSWTNLPKRDTNGTTYEYKLDEVSQTADYDSTVSNDGGAWTITNQHKAVTKLSVKKVWNDENDVDGLRSTLFDKVTFKVLRSVKGGDPVDTGKTIVLTADNAAKDGSWQGSLDNLDKYDAEGNEYTYSLKEVLTDAQKAKYEGKIEVSGPKYDANQNASYTFTATNTHKAEKVDVKVKKVWQDNDNKAEKRPTSVKVQLYTVDAEGSLSAVEGKTETLSEDNEWSTEWENLPKNEAGKKIGYTVRELDPETNEPVDADTELSNGYKVTYESDGYGTDTYSYTVTNTYEEEEEEQAFSLSGYSMAAEAAPVSEPDKVCYVDPKIYKKLEGRALKAGEFTFQLVNDKTGEVVSTAENDEAGMVDFDKAADKTGNPENPSCLEFTAAGTYTYTVRETTGYVKDLSIDYSTEVVKFVTKIAADKNGALYEEESHYVVYPSQADAEAKTNGKVYASSEHPAITNKVKSLHIALTKTDANTGAKLAGATYGLYRVDDSASTGSVLVATATSGSNGVMTFAAGDASGIVANGTYYFQEISAPDGYAVSEAKTCEFTIEKANDGTYTLAYKDGTVSNAAHAGTAADPIVFKPGTGVTDTKIAITFGKVSSDGTALSGAKLAVRDEAGNDVASWTTDGKGYVVSGLVVGAKYVLYEKAAPEGYAKAAEVTFTVDEYGKVSIVGGASYNSLLNAYATGSQLNLVDYKQTELENKQEIVREKGVSEKKGTKPTKSSMPATGDNSRFSVIPAIVGTLMIAAGLATRRRREE